MFCLCHKSICRRLPRIHHPLSLRSTASPPLFLLRPSSSATTPDSAPSPPDPCSLFSAYHDPIILPPLLPHHLAIPNFPKNEQQGLPKFHECLATLYALIQSGKMDRAERLCNSLKTQQPKLMPHVMDTNVHNVFIDGWLARINHVPHRAGKLYAVQSGLKWFLKMKKESVKYQPDATSYALLLRGLLRAELLDQTCIYLAQAQRTDASGDLLRQIVNHPALSSELDPCLVPKWHTILRENNIPLSDTESKIAQETELSPVHDNPQILQHEISEIKKKSNILYADQLGLPEARPVGSVGLPLLKDNLRVIPEHSVGDSEFGKYALQLKLEDASYDVAIQKLQKEWETRSEGRTVLLRTNKSLNASMWQWHQALTRAIQQELDECYKASSPGTPDVRSLYAPFLSQLSPKKLAIITISELLRSYVPSKFNDNRPTTMKGVNKISRIVTTIGAAVENEIRAEFIRSKMRSKGEKPGSMTELDARIKKLDDRLFMSQRIFNMTTRRLYAELQGVETRGSDGCLTSTPNGMSSGSWIDQWPPTSHARVGSVLLSLVLDVAKVSREVVDSATGIPKTVEVPAFYHSMVEVAGKCYGILKFHPLVSEMLGAGPIGNSLKATYLPMVVRPRPWLTYMSGGYLTARSPCMRIKDGSPEQMAYLRATAKHNRLNEVLVALDVLGATPWKVNEDVFRVVLEAWNSGEQFADLPPEINDGNKHKYEPTVPVDKTDKAAFRAYVIKLDEYKKFIRNAYSQRCDTNYKIEVARMFLGQEMYFPHNIDFRGRAYPMPAYLNHMSSDLCRGLMVFSKSKPLGERGWFWLKVHMASLHGHNKISFEDREKWVVEHMDEIVDSATNPMTGRRWWSKAEDPWQCLAVCFEITKAVQSGDPITYQSHIPVHQDGSCNGLQHYAALGGDLIGAKHVNLIAGDKPADVYTYVAEIASRIVDADVLKGDKRAIRVQGQIHRKTVKQTVMTNVYGVTSVGARQQVENRLKESKSYEGENLYPLSRYISRVILTAIGTIFHSAQKFQHWLNVSASLISKSVLKKHVDQNPGNMSSVVWTTPLGLTCVQPYRKTHLVSVQTLLQSVTLNDPNNPSPVSTNRQKTAFPPNFVHSLDASHMMMTAVACTQAGLTFAAVHDSFWTHACDVDVMNGIIRDEFVRLHSQPILENLYTEFKVRYRDHIIERHVKDRIFKAFEASMAAPVDDAGSDFNNGSDAADASTEDGSTDGPRNSSKWVPLDFPALPKRGVFNVDSVKSSPYFFH